MNGTKRSTEAMGCQNTSIGKRSALGGSTSASRCGRSESENVGLSNANIGENPMCITQDYFLFIKKVLKQFYFRSIFYLGLLQLTAFGPKSSVLLSPTSTSRKFG